MALTPERIAELDAYYNQKKPQVTLTPERMAELDAYYGKKKPSFLDEMGANFQHGIRSAQDLLSGNYQDIGRTVPTAKTEALADKLFPAGSDGSFMDAVRNVRNTSASDWSGALLEKLAETPEGKALSAIVGVNPVYNAASTAITRYVNPAIEEATGIHPDNLALAETVLPIAGVKKASSISDPTISAAKAVGGKVMNTIRGRQETEVPKQSIASDPSASYEKVYDRLSAEMSPSELDTFLNSYASTKGQSLIEKGGERVRRLGEGAAQYPTGATKAVGFFQDAVGNAPDKLKRSISKNISPETNYYDTLDNLVSTGREAAAPLYKSAFKSNQSVKSPLINKILATPEGRDALNVAVKNIQNEMARVAVPDKELTLLAKEVSDIGLMPKVGQVASGLKLRALDEVKKAMDSTINMAYRAGDEAQAARIIKLKSALVNELDSLDKSGLYKKARKTSGDYLSNKDAMDRGLGFLREDPEIIQRLFRDYGSAEKKSFKTGVVKAIRNDIDNRIDGRNVAVLFERPANRQKLQSILSPKEYASLLADARAIDGIYKLRNQVLGNSRTALRQIAAEDFTPAEQGWITDIAQRGFTATARKEVVNLIARKFDGLSDKAAGEVADILFETDPKKKHQIVRNLAAVAKKAEKPNQAVAKLQAFYGTMDAINQNKNRAANIGGVAAPKSPQETGEQRGPLKITIRPSDKIK